MPRLPAVCCAVILGGCSTLPGRDFPRQASPAVTPPNPGLVQPFAAAQRTHPEQSGFRLYTVGVDGLLLRLELIKAAQRSLDLQYYIFHGDGSGRLVTEALAQAASRGVRVRILVDDAAMVAGDDQLFALAGQPNVQIRVFNPWRYRGHNGFLRGVEYLFSGRRLDYRMHNKLFVADGAIALVGGRNIADEYFQVDPQLQFADDDVLAAGPVVMSLEATFEQFWSSELAVPAQALLPAKDTGSDAAAELAQRITTPQFATIEASHYQEKLAQGEPLASVLSGASVLAWASAEVACDSPDKGKKAAQGERVSGLLFPPVAKQIRATQHELTLITPYLVPTGGEFELLLERRAAAIDVRILTSSLENNDSLAAQSAYMHYRVPLLEAGVELYELRARPQSPRGTGQSHSLSQYGNYSLHAKLLVFDRSGIFVGSMNYDERSRRLNTELGLIIHSPELAEQSARHFAAMIQAQNAYAVTLQPATPGDKPELVWHTEESGQPLNLTNEPARSSWQKFEVHFLELLPLDPEL
jgi:putative cardiolipin synthase